jgi:hypothetical protein
LGQRFGLSDAGLQRILLGVNRAKLGRDLLISLFCLPKCLAFR